MKKYISDLLWFEIKNEIPEKKAGPGRPEYDNRKTFEGILYVLDCAIPWSMMPIEFGNYKTIHGKYMRWQRSGMFYRLFNRAKRYYHNKKGFKNWFAFDTTSKKAPFASFGGKNPTDRARNGIKYAVMVDRRGAPMQADIFPANVHDSKTFLGALKKMKKSKKVRIIAADSAFDSKLLRSASKEKNFALIASTNVRRKKGSHKYYAPCRYIIEQFFGILSWFRGIKTCWAKTKESALGFLHLACTLRIYRLAGILR